MRTRWFFFFGRSYKDSLVNGDERSEVSFPPVKRHSLLFACRPFHPPFRESAQGFCVVPRCLPLTPCPEPAVPLHGLNVVGSLTTPLICVIPRHMFLARGC